MSDGCPRCPVIVTEGFPRVPRNWVKHYPSSISKNSLKKAYKVGVIIIPHSEVKKLILREQRSLPNISELASGSWLGPRLTGSAALSHHTTQARVRIARRPL